MHADQPFFGVSPQRSGGASSGTAGAFQLLVGTVPNPAVRLTTVSAMDTLATFSTTFVARHTQRHSQVMDSTLLTTKGRR
jgi:hypothetical protein